MYNAPTVLKDALKPLHGVAVIGEKSVQPGMTPSSVSAVSAVSENWTSWMAERVHSTRAIGSSVCRWNSPLLSKRCSMRKR